MRQTLAAVITTAMAAHAARAQALQPIHLAAEPFRAPEVRLLDGPFAEAQARDAEYLLSLDTDRLLARYRADAGLEPRAEGYGGWEAEGIGGHTLGHYLSAISRMYAATGDRRFQDRAADIVAQLAECQAANGDGYVAAIPDGRRVFAEVARGDIRTKGFDLNGVWVPWYTIHKELAGLRDANLYCGNSQALAVMRGLADWALRTTDNLSPEQLHTMLRCEQGGMNEVAADLYALTGDARYLTLAERFNDHQVLDPLAAGKDILPGLHANTQVPKLIGAARQHEVTGDPALGAAALFFWNAVTAHHTYATGGNSLNEYFGPPGAIASRLDGNTTETCNTYNMLRLTRRLHSWTADARHIDYYERAPYTHTLASQNHLTGAVCYYVPLRPGSQKPYQQLDSDFTCCVGTGMENHASYGDMIYSHDDEGIFVNLFIASTLRWPDAGLQLTQETRFPRRAAHHAHALARRPA
ncbi:MAG: glycoside hydrolase family 127 protein [Phycisphaerales bacterium]|nr:glycoside hydrolase family 127 protein [Phycisphaerales bacterium]